MIRSDLIEEIKSYEVFIRKEYVFDFIACADYPNYSSIFYRSSTSTTESSMLHIGSWSLHGYRSNNATYLYVYDSPLLMPNKQDVDNLCERIQMMLGCQRASASDHTLFGVREYYARLGRIPKKYCIAAIALEDGVVRDAVSGQELTALPVPKRISAYMSKTPAGRDRADGLQPWWRGLRARVWAGEPVTLEFVREFWPKPGDLTDEMIERIRQACTYAQWPCTL